MSVGLIGSPISLAKIRWIALTLLRELKSANTDFLQKVKKYQIHGTCARLVSWYLPLSPSLLVSAAPAVSIISAISTFFSLAAIISVDVAETNTSFLTLFWVPKTIIRIITLFFAVKVLNIGDILLFSFDTIDTSYRRVMVMTLFLLVIVPRIFLIVLVFCVDLALIGKRLLGVLLIRYVNRESISKLIFFKVFLHLFCRSVSLETLKINLAGS